MGVEEKKKNNKLIILWAILFVIIILAFKFNVDKKITASIVILYGLITPVFYGIISVLSVWLGAVPWAGPLLLKLISIPVVWILHGIAYLGSVVFVAKGESKKAMDARILSSIFFVGFILGYIVSKIF